MYKIRLLRAFVLICLGINGTNAFCMAENGEFGNHFSDSTLRLDYVFGGRPGSSTVALGNAWKIDGWYGRRGRLAELPLAGSGQVTVTSLDGDTLYRSSFSSLYLEWLETGDTISRAFEHTVRVPLPREPARIGLTLTDSHRRPIAGHKYVYSPVDYLVRQKSPSAHPTGTIHGATWNGPRVNVAILPEGFREDEMERFDSLARVTVEQILAHEPFGRYADRFNFTAVHVPSRDSGVSVPHQGRLADTAFGSHFSTFYSDRYLTTPNVFAVHDALAGVPYDHIIILANVEVYGGGGIYNSYTLTTTGHKDFKPVVVHEFGHSFGGLADEYFYDSDVMTDTYPADVEPWEPNVTTLVDFDSKWKHLLAPATPVPTPVGRADEFPVGVYEGAAYSKHGIYRPADNCRMRINNIDHFCPACIDALARLILFYTEVQDD